MAQAVEVRKLAMERAVKLVMNKLVTDDPELKPIAAKLSRLSHHLSGDLQEGRVRGLLGTAFLMTKYTPGDGDVQSESTKLLTALADRISSLY